MASQPSMGLRAKRACGDDSCHFPYIISDGAYLTFRCTAAHAMHLTPMPAYPESHNMKSTTNLVASTILQVPAEPIHPDYVQGESLVKLVIEDSIAQRISIDGCRDIMRHLRNQDAPTRHRLQDVLVLKGQRVSNTANRVAGIRSQGSMSAHPLCEPMRSVNRNRNPEFRFATC